jgi:4'-phosphopantetheinyl transferase
MIINFAPNKKVELYEASLGDKSVKAFIYIVDMNDFHDDIIQFVPILSSQETSKAQSYYTKILAERYLISHGILRLILGHYANQSPKELQFITNDYGKPFLAQSNIYFNMSHSQNMAAYIVAFDHLVGIDIELVDKNINVDELCSMVLTNHENKVFSALAPAEKIYFFYQLWTRKEALVKAIGQGLRHPINTIEAEHHLFFEQSLYYSQLLPLKRSDCIAAIAANPGFILSK